MKSKAKELQETNHKLLALQEEAVKSKAEKEGTKKPSLPHLLSEFEQKVSKIQHDLEASNIKLGKEREEEEREKKENSNLVKKLEELQTVLAIANEKNKEMVRSPDHQL